MPLQRMCTPSMGHMLTKNGTPILWKNIPSSLIRSDYVIASNRLVKLTGLAAIGKVETSGDALLGSRLHCTCCCVDLLKKTFTAHKCTITIKSSRGVIIFQHNDSFVPLSWLPAQNSKQISGEDMRVNCTIALSRDGRLYICTVSRWRIHNTRT